MSKAASISSCSVLVRPPQRGSGSLLFRTSRTLSSSVPVSLHALARPLKASASKVVLQVTILPALLDSLKQAVAMSCGKVVDILGIEPVSRSQNIRVRLGVEGGSVNAAIEAIIRTLPSGEIGRFAVL